MKAKIQGEVEFDFEGQPTPNIDLDRSPHADYNRWADAMDELATATWNLTGASNCAITLPSGAYDRLMDAFEARHPQVSFPPSALDKALEGFPKRFQYLTGFGKIFVDRAK